LREVFGAKGSHYTAAGFLGNGPCSLHTRMYREFLCLRHAHALDSADLLKKIKKRHQNIVRIVLSGQSNKESVMRSIDPTHQIFSKPCHVEELKLRLSWHLQ